MQKADASGALLALKQWWKRKPPFSSCLHYKVFLARVTSRASCIQNNQLIECSWAAMILGWENKELCFMVSGDHFKTGFLVELVVTLLELTGHLTPVFPFFYLKPTFSIRVAQSPYGCLQYTFKTYYYSPYICFSRASHEIIWYHYPMIYYYSLLLLISLHSRADEAKLLLCCLNAISLITSWELSPYLLPKSLILL